MIPLLLLACTEPALTPLPAAATAGSSTAPQETPECVASEQDVAADDDSSVGVSAQEIAEFTAPREAIFTYASGDETMIRLGAALSGDAVFRTWAPIATGAGDCPNDSLVLSLALALDTDDGAFTESWVQEVSVWQWEELLSLNTYLDMSEHQGSFRQAGAEELSLVVGIVGDEWHGEIVTIDDGNATTDMTTECGIGSWNSALVTGC